MTTRRATQAEATRTEIVAAARELFLARGYVGTSIGAVAEHADVAVQTVYNSIGNKAALLSAVLDLAAAGPYGPRPVEDFMQERAGSSHDLTSLIHLLADWFTEVNERTAEVFALIRQAAVVYPEVAALEQERAERRLSNHGLAAATARKRGGLNSGMTDVEAAAAIWAIGHPQVYRSLVIDGSWTPERYRAWAERSLYALLQ